VRRESPSAGRAEQNPLPVSAKHLHISWVKTRENQRPKRARISGSGRRPVDLSQSKVRAALTNGTALMLRDVDGRLAWCRRLRDLVSNHVSDLGGESNLSTAELVLVKRAAMLTLQLEMMECNNFAA
jgi:hypothetical protein